ncbi:peptidoglycan DD-metalloendopeptidase family protein [Flavobacterium daejeonense]|uniref:peptidoglycan DD-metalloendopeptidase family protein n=1 Tax=Flavobacterium daejeonense TaxID=350893 RepID=UPI00047B1A48|nr:peptidoglycan DD-metalloendopeptidase family protein [Flavobacterium daejeonense]
MKNTIASGKNKLFSLLLLFVIWVTSYAQENPNLHIKANKNADNTVDFYYEKGAVGSFIVSLNFSKLENAENDSIPKFNVTANSGFLFKLKPLNKNKKIDFFYSYNVTQGYLNPKINSALTYELPFKNGKKVKIYWGTRPGISPDRWKKYIVYSNNQDSVFTMRKGVVVFLRTLTRFDKDETAQETKKVAVKEIVVEHSDGTFASYSGIEENSIAVKVGQNINSHDYLGLMDKSNGGRYSLTFDIYYHEADTEEFRGNLVAVNPIFLTQNGSEKLENKKEYVVKHN